MRLVQSPAIRKVNWLFIDQMDKLEIKILMEEIHFHQEDK